MSNLKARLERVERVLQAEKQGGVYLVGYPSGATEEEIGRLVEEEKEELRARGIEPEMILILVEKKEPRGVR